MMLQMERKPVNGDEENTGLQRHPGAFDRDAGFSMMTDEILYIKI